MHPLNNHAFGSDTGKIKVHFYNGSSVVTGYIVKQPSATKWVVTADGTTLFTCKLAKTVSAPAAGEFTIYCNSVTAGTASGSTEHVVKIDGHHITTAEGNRYMWTINSPLPTGTGYAKLDTNS